MTTHEALTTYATACERRRTGADRDEQRARRNAWFDRLAAAPDDRTAHLAEWMRESMPVWLHHASTLVWPVRTAVARLRALRGL